MRDLGMVLFGTRHLRMKRVSRTKPRGSARLILRLATKDAYLTCKGRLGWRCVALRTPADGGWWTIHQSA